MKKICICTTLSLTMETFVLETAKYLYEQSGYDVTLICNGDDVFQKSLPDYIHFIPIHMARGINLTGFKSVFDFIKVFKKEKFDMVQYSTPNAACYASIAARVCKVPIRLYCQWGIRYVGLKGVSRKIFKIIEKMVCRNSTDIRAVSILNKSFAVSEGLYSDSKAAVTGNGGTIGVDISKFDINHKAAWRKEIREQYEIGPSCFVFGFCGRISVDKGCGELLAAFKNIAYDNHNIRLLIVGPMEDACGLDYQLVGWAHESKQVVLTGIVERNEMHKFYAAMDVLVHPTYREGFGMVIQEAGALGVPSITTNVPGASEVMENGISSVHVEAKNIEALTKAMRYLERDLDRVEIMGEAAYHRTRRLYERHVMLENQRIDYEKLLDN